MFRTYQVFINFLIDLSIICGIGWVGLCECLSQNLDVFLTQTKQRDMPIFGLL